MTVTMRVTPPPDGNCHSPPTAHRDPYAVALCVSFFGTAWTPALVRATHTKGPSRTTGAFVSPPMGRSVTGGLKLRAVIALHLIQHAKPGAVRLHRVRDAVVRIA